MPLLTKISHKRPWVHEEIGYAFAVGIPVLPVLVGVKPGEMTVTCQAIQSDLALEGIDQSLRTAGLNGIVAIARRKAGPFQVRAARYPEDRAKLLYESAQALIDKSQFGMVRKRSWLSCFSIPDRTENNPAWNAYEGDAHRTDHFRIHLRNERNAMEKHAREAGCKLMLYLQPTPRQFTIGGEQMFRARLSNLIEFAQKMPEAGLSLVVLNELPVGTTTIVGDWFLSDGLVASADGVRETFVSWHAPTVLNRIEQFDREFNELAGERALGREAALTLLKAALGCDAPSK
jgi:hypothetical protein